MKIVKYPQSKKKVSPKKVAVNLYDRLSGVSGGESIQANRQAQEEIIPLFDQALNDNFTMFCNYPLPELEVEIPMLLVGPPGIRVLYPCALRGIYRARGDTWLMFNGRKRTFEPARNNLIGLTLMFARAIKKFLSDHNINLPEVEPIILFSDPNIHVDTARPAARIVLREAIEKYVQSLVESPAVLNNEETFKIIELITKPLREKIEAQRLATQARARQAAVQQARRSAAARSASGRTPRQAAPARPGGLPFTTSQLLILGGFFMIWVIIVAAFLINFFFMP